jgi:hypothetical protein
MLILIKENFKLGVRYKFTSINHSHIYSGILQNIIHYPEGRFIFINVQDETTFQLSDLHSIPSSWVTVYTQALLQLPGFLNLEISKF